MNSAIVGAIIGALGGGIVGYFLKAIQDYGKLMLMDKSITIEHSDPMRDYIIKRIQVDLSFSNTSGINQTLSDINIRYYDGDNYHEFSIEGYTTKPLGVITAKDTKCLTFSLLPIYEIRSPVPINDFQFIELAYKVKNQTKKEFMYAADILYKDTHKTWYSV